MMTISAALCYSSQASFVVGGDADSVARAMPLLRCTSDKQFVLGADPGKSSSRPLGAGPCVREWLGTVHRPRAYFYRQTFFLKRPNTFCKLAKWFIARNSLTVLQADQGDQGPATSNVAKPCLPLPL